MRAKKANLVVSLVGRPNVGKSTVYNRLMHKNFKIMAYDTPGVTRDRHYSILSLIAPEGKEDQDLILVDTGGFYPEKVDEQSGPKDKYATPFFNIMAEQAQMAVNESDLILLVVDVREGLNPYDKMIFDYIRSQNKQCWLLINKFDSDKQWGDEAEFYEIGINTNDVHIISAEHNRGLENLKDRLYELAINQEIIDSSLTKGIKPNYDISSEVAIIGAPNAGKSTLLNLLVGQQRALVSDIAGTTVDPIEAYFDLYFTAKQLDLLKSKKNEFRVSDQKILEKYLEDEIEETQLIPFNTSLNENSDLETEQVDIDIDNKHKEGEYRTIKIVDTAGIRKQRLVKGFIEEQSVYRALKAISLSDMVIVLIDVTKGITHHDRRLCDIALEKGKSIIVCLNKCDLIKDTMQDPVAKKAFFADLRVDIPWLGFCEIVTISALKGRFIRSLKDAMKKTILARSKKMSTGHLNKTIAELVDRNPIMINKSKGISFKVKYASLIKSDPPTVLMFTNRSKDIPANFRKYLINAIRREYQLVNTPVHLIFRTSTDLEKRAKNKSF